MISTGLKHGFEHRTPWVNGAKIPIQTVLSTQSFKMEGSINTEHKLRQNNRVSVKAASTFAKRPLGHKFAGQPATAISNGMTLRAGQRSEPAGR